MSGTPRFHLNHPFHSIGRSLGSLALAAIFAVGLSAQAQAAPAGGAPRRSVQHVPGELIVKLRDRQLSAAQAQSLVTAAISKRLAGKADVLSVSALATDSSVQKVVISKDSMLNQAIRALRGETAVRYAEPNFIYRKQDEVTIESRRRRPPRDGHVPSSGIPNDPDFDKVWSMKNVGQNDSNGQAGKVGSDINVVPIWAEGNVGSHEMVVAVIDTGIDWTHPDLKANLFTNPNEIADNNVDDDGNGFVDDVHGWNFVSGSGNKNSADDHNHGTHCAGTIGASGNDGVGIVGVNWKVRLMPLKFLSASGSGSLEGALNAINYARMMKVNIMSNSWGGGGYSQALFDAIKAAKDEGILFVAAAGNDSSNNDSRPTYPASYQIDNVVSVAATDNQDKIANFSNFGIRSVHVAAPGDRIYSTVRNGGYASYRGTSMACPHVAGVAALLWSANPGWSFAEVKERLIRTSDPVPGLKNRVLAKGRVNAYNALKGIVPPSDDPDESLWQTVDFAVESDHPYQNSTEKAYEISMPGVRYLRVIFDKVDVEEGYDAVVVENGNREVVEELTGKMEGYTTAYVTGDKAVVRLKADGTINGWGFKVSRIQIIR